MQKYWRYRFYGLIIFGLILLVVGCAHCLTDFGIIIWGVGVCVGFTGVIMQVGGKYNEFEKAN